MKLIISLILLLPILSRANTEYSCSHIMVCALVKKAAIENNKQVKITSAFQINGDPHQFSASPKLVKKIIKLENLIVGPMELHPWLKNILKNSKENYTLLELPQSQKSKYSKYSKETLAHFWLNKKDQCELQKQIELKLFNINSEKNCSHELDTLNLKSIVFVITHDSLRPLLERSGAKTISLSGSDHHHEISTHEIKQVHMALKKYKNINWIIEKHMKLPSNIKSLIRSNDSVIHLETLPEKIVNLDSFYQKLVDTILKEAK